MVSAAKKAAARKGKKKEAPAEGAPQAKDGAPGAIKGVLTWDVSLVGIFMLLVLLGFYVVSGTSNTAALAHLPLPVEHSGSIEWRLAQ